MQTEEDRFWGIRLSALECVTHIYVSISLSPRVTHWKMYWFGFRAPRLFVFSFYWQTVVVVLDVSWENCASFPIYSLIHKTVYESGVHQVDR